MKLVVGLGNPGAKYRGTRHNVGFDVLAEVARRLGGPAAALKFDAELADAFDGGEKVLLAAPQTYMNESGRAVRAICDFYQAATSDLLVVCDDINLDCGRLRMRPGGSDGGQKGLRDIINRLGTEEFARLRIGIGRPPGRMDAAAYVLSRFRTEEREVIDEAIQRAADGVEVWRRAGLEAAMNRVNAPEG
ncbi:MAG TPA: aminoacyl-tRNA hydrolase [Planctomycetaceae bacterium]|nr:aminoacyl-tRNA hydrolase [Planctomycetaceae bacterium]